MHNQRRTFGLLALLVVAAATFAWYRFGPGETPAGQPSLVTVDASQLEALRADFNRDVTQVRLIVLLAPT